jgi:polysaccharide biosynthesis protein PslG
MTRSAIRRRQLFLATLPVLLVLAQGPEAEAKFSGYNEDYSVPEAASMAAEGGARLARFNVWWSSAEPTPGAYDWSQADQQFRSVRRAGLIPIPVVYQTPAWASSHSGRSDRPPKAGAYDDYARFVRAVVERYRPGQLAVWNEPNNRRWWGPWPVSDYEMLFRRVRRELLGLDVELLAVSTAPIPGWQAYLSEFARDVGGRYSLSQHIYPRGLSEAARDMAAQWRTGRRIADGRRLWVTELGVLSTAVGELRQADILANACTMIKSPVIVYSLLDHPDKFEWTVGYGVASHEFSPKPAYYALQRTSRR